MSFNFQALWIRADEKLKFLFPTIVQLYVSELELPKDQQNPLFYQFFQTLIRGSKLLKKCKNISPFKLCLKYRYFSKILHLEEEIDGFLDLMPAHILLDARKLKLELQDFCQELQPADMSNMLKESICKHASMLTNNASCNTMLLQQMRLEDLCENSETEKVTKYSVHDTVPVKSQFHVGLEKSIGDLKRLLFQNEVSVVGVQCMGGGGKTTLASAICNDDHIKGYFQNVLFITVSQSPDLKGILEMMWEKIVGRKNPEFQNVEDARRQLGQQLQMQSRSTLVILDDVWSRANLEKLLFESPGLKTLITTRDSFTIPRNSSTALYQLTLLDQDDALSLFSFWAFGQTSIPSNADANLVKEVQAECKGLPLALKVIGSSLRGEPRAAWESYKLSRGALISDYQRDGLLRCLETSISFLDDIARECFLDLGAFPEDKKICVDALLDIWVNVRKLERQDAFAILLELARRNLLNLTSDPRAAILNENASELYFSIHYVMRDLASYLGGRDNMVDKKRLLMPGKKHTVMKDHQPMQTTSWSFANLTNIIQNGVQMFDSFISHICNEIVHKFDSMCQTEFLVQEVNIRKMYDALSKIHETNTKLGRLSNFFEKMFRDYHNGWGDVGSIILEFKSKLHKM